MIKVTVAQIVLFNLQRLPLDSHVLLSMIQLQTVHAQEEPSVTVTLYHMTTACMLLVTHKGTSFEDLSRLLPKSVSHVARIYLSCFYKSNLCLLGTWSKSWI